MISIQSRWRFEKSRSDFPRFLTCHPKRLPDTVAQPPTSLHAITGRRSKCNLRTFDRLISTRTIASSSELSHLTSFLKSSSMLLDCGRGCRLLKVPFCLAMSQIQPFRHLTRMPATQNNRMWSLLFVRVPRDGPESERTSISDVVSYRGHPWFCSCRRCSEPKPCAQIFFTHLSGYLALPRSSDSILCK
jgi:hypothetical protein